MLDPTGSSMAQLLLILFLTVTSCLGQRLARETCDATRRLVDVQMANAHVVLGGLFDIREPGTDGYGCGQPAPDLMQIYEAAKWAIQQVNNRNFMNGVRMGMKAYDTCGSVEQSLAAAYNFYPQSSSRPTYCLASTNQNALGFLGPMNSWASLPVAGLIKHFPAAAVSPRAAASALSDRALYPTFLRTIPSAVAVSRVLMELLERLQWNRIVFVYIDNSYGRDGLDQILKYAQSSGKCIVQAVPINRDESASQIQARLSVLRGYDVNGGIFWGTPTESLVAMESLLPLIGRIQWIFTDLDTTRTYNQRVAQGALVVNSATTVITEFRDYWLGLQETNPPTDNPWFQDWYMIKYDCRLPGVTYQPYISKGPCPTRDFTTKQNEYTQSQYVETTIKAVYAFAAAVKSAQAALCQGAAGFCNQFRTMPASTFQSYLDRVNYVFTAGDGMGSLVGQTVSFDSNGDIASSSFSILNYNNNAFVNVGSYENNNLNFDVTAATFYDTNRFTPIPAPTSPCPADGCQNCLLPNTDYEYTYIPGDLLIGSMLGMRNTGSDPLSCGGYSDFGTEAMVAMKYALGNYKQVLGNVLNGVDLGALVVDQCTNKFISSAFLNDLLSDRKTLQDPAGGTIDMEYLRSFINFRASSVAIDTSRILGQYKIPEIETGATADQLSDKMLYPYFNRVIPSSDDMNSAIVNILKRFKWDYAQIVYRDDAFGMDGVASLKREAAMAQVCIAGAYSMGLGAPAVVEGLRENSQAKAVIIFGYLGDVRALLEAVKDKGAVGEFVFIGIDTWADRDEYVEGFTDVADGSFTIKQSSQTARFNQYLATNFRTLDSIRADPVVSKLYEVRFQCYLNSGNRGTYTQPCPSPTGANSITSTSTYSPFVIHAVYLMAQALHDTLTQVCGSGYDGLCTAFRDKDAVSDILLQQLRNASYTEPQSGVFRMINGQGVADFDIINYENGRGYMTIGSYSTSTRTITNLQEANVRLPGGATLTSWTSTCTSNCPQCYMFQQQPFLYIPGDIMLGGMFSVSNPGNQGPFTCGSAKTTNGFQYTAAMQYALDMVNSDQAPVSLNGIKLGGLAFDHCNNQERPFSLLSSIYSGLMDRSLQMMGMYKNTLARKIAAWLIDTTASTHEAGEFLEPYSIPIVSPSATATSLMNISSFYRTIQGDDTVASAMVKTVKSLGLPYVQVVHAASNYGRGGLNAVKAAGQQEGICVISSTEFDSSITAVEVIEKLIAGPSHVVILYLGTSAITSLLQAKNSYIDQTAASKLVFVSPEPFTGVVQSVNLRNTARNMLSVQLKTPNLDSFTAYMNTKVTDGYRDNPFFARYYMAVFNCNLPGHYDYNTNCPDPLPELSTAGDNFALSNFIEATVNAVYSSAAALDLTLKQLCGENYDGVCAEFTNAADLNIRLVENLRQTNFDSMGRNFRFLNREGNTGYNILRFNGNNYETVGNFEGAALQLTQDLTPYYTDTVSTCVTPCLECIQSGLNFSYVPGDILIGGLFDVHSKSLNPFSCGAINTLHGFQLLEAFHYALGEVNSKEGAFANILRGTILGGVGLDSCESAIRTGYLVSNIHNGLTNLAKNGLVIDPDNIDLYVGGYSSESSLYLARILSDLKIPQISYAATSTALLDQFRYPYFFRTVPADDNQARAMLSFLDNHDIRYVQVLYTQSNYGEFGAAAFERLAPNQRICVGQMVRFPDNGTVSKESSNDVVTQLLARPVANTVVVFAGTSYINALLRAVKRNPAAIGKFRFLGSETWANNEDAILGVEEIAKGSVTFNLETSNLKVYDDYLSGKTPANSQDNPWFGEYYEAIQNCYLTIPDGTYRKQCPQTPEDIISSIRYKQDPGVLHVVNSVFSAAFAIDFTLRELCGANYTTVCEAYRNRADTREIILRNLQQVSFTDKSNEMFQFTDRHEGNKGYDIYNLVSVPVQGYVYRKIGSYASDGVITSSYNRDYDGSCTRPDACTECPTIRNVGVRYAIDEPLDSNDDAMTVVGIFDVHEQGSDPYRCGKLRMDGYRQFLSFFYTMQQVVAEFNLNIRTVAIDTCSNSLRTDQDTYNLIYQRGLCNSKFDNPELVGLENIAGFVVAGDENTLGASRVLDAFKVAYVSPSAQSIVFNDTEVFPYLARTTPPRGQLMKALAEILEAAGWDYVVAVSSTFRFDDNGYNQFLSVSGGKTCVRSAFNLPLDANMDDAKQAVTQLSSAEGSNVVVLFTSMADTMMILQAAHNMSVADKYFWVFTDPNADTWRFPDGIYFRGMVLKLRSSPVEEYRKYANLTTYNDAVSNRNDRNIPRSWYEEYYQQHFRCQLRDAEFPNTDYTKICTKSETFNGSDTARMDRYTMSTIAAAYSIVNGISSFCGRKTFSECNIHGNRTAYFQSLLNIGPVQLDDKIGLTLDGPFNLEFNNERFWDPGFTAWSIEHDARVDHGYVQSLSKLVDFKDNALRESVSNRITGDFTSSCPVGRECGCAKPETGNTLPFEQDKAYMEPRNYFLYGKDGTKIHEWPVWAIAVAVLTCLGLLVTIVSTLILLFMYPIRGGTTVLGFMVLLGIIGIYLVNFAFFMPASFSICATRRFCMGVIYMIVFSALLVKAVDNWRYNDLLYEEEKKYRKLTSAASLFMIAIGLVLIQVIIPTEWLILVAPTASNMNEFGIHDYWWCDPVEMYDIGLVLSFIFVMFIVLLTSIFAAMGWDGEVNNRESRWILIASICTAGCFLVWMIVTTNAGATYRDPAVAIANFVNATALLICIPLRKLGLLFAYRRMEKLEEPPAIYENIEYPNNAYDPDYEFSRQDSKQDSEVAF